MSLGSALRRLETAQRRCQPAAGEPRLELSKEPGAGWWGEAFADKAYKGGQKVKVTVSGNTSTSSCRRKRPTRGLRQVGGHPGGDPQGGQ